MNQQLEAYMQEQEQAAAELGEYLNRNGKADDNWLDNNLGQFFNDPLFKSFWGSDPFFERQFGEQSNSLKKDW